MVIKQQMEQQTVQHAEEEADTDMDHTLTLQALTIHPDPLGTDQAQDRADPVAQAVPKEQNGQEVDQQQPTPRDKLKV